jgi:hypothetical protein
MCGNLARHIGIEHGRHAWLCGCGFVTRDRLIPLPLKAQIEQASELPVRRVTKVGECVVCGGKLSRSATPSAFAPLLPECLVCGALYSRGELIPLLWDEDAVVNRGPVGPNGTAARAKDIPAAIFKRYSKQATVLGVLVEPQTDDIASRDVFVVLEPGQRLDDEFVPSLKVYVNFLLATKEPVLCRNGACVNVAKRSVFATLCRQRWRALVNATI